MKETIERLKLKLEFYQKDVKRIENLIFTSNDDSSLRAADDVNVALVSNTVAQSLAKGKGRPDKGGYQ